MSESPARPDVSGRRCAFRLSAPILGALLVAGCSFSDLQPKSSLVNPDDLEAVQALEGITVSPANWPQADWWSGFADAQLDTLIAEALENAPSLRAAAARVRQAEASQGLQESRLMPEVDGSLSVIRQRYSADGTAPAAVAGTWQNIGQGMLNGSYELDFWSRNKAAVEAAVGRRRAAEVDQYTARLVLSSSIVQAYIDLQATYDQLAVEQQMLEQQERIHALTRQRFAAELDSQIDIKQSEASITASRARIIALKEALELGRNRLAALVGKGPDRGRSIQPPQLKPSSDLSIPGNLPADLLGHRPDVVAQRWRVEAASQDINVAKAQFYPNVNLTSFIGLQSMGLDTFARGASHTLGFGPAISLPIFEGGRLRANLSAQNATYDLAVENYNQTLVEALHDIADQLSSIRWLQERIRQQELAVQTATDAYELVNQRYGAGLASYIQVLVSQTAVYGERRSLVTLQARGLSLQANLSRALGGGYRPQPTSERLATISDIIE
ncbi:efflux transporter outer membrane subunit [Pseudomonas oryzae]|uniref:Efflux transporter, outer membrane factor (OMF) lipoprotein, NodT family n=1 Tax=Pseudomonas oryzae TaxID=1392877 RepID=A0A1H1QLW9_9PSED|nr:efflux transporter outer membrane subunit [Pseudomonas oryzae]SDS24448.1 efflux transporter, outer membrane factor (OMF) lipoprotein, NodT family [Pseudomonas oryzae]